MIRRYHDGYRRLLKAGLHLNGVRAFKNGCSGSVFCSAFKSELVRAARSGLNVFGFEPSNVLFGVRVFLFMFVLKCS